MGNKSERLRNPPTTLSEGRVQHFCRSVHKTKYKIEQKGRKERNTAGRQWKKNERRKEVQLGSAHHVERGFFVKIC